MLIKIMKFDTAAVFIPGVFWFCTVSFATQSTTTVRVGDVVELKCPSTETDKNPIWSKRSLENIISTKSKVKGILNDSNNQSEYILFIHNITKNDEDIYCCTSLYNDSVVTFCTQLYVQEVPVIHIRRINNALNCTLLNAMIEANFSWTFYARCGKELKLNNKNGPLLYLEEYELNRSGGTFQCKATTYNNEDFVGSIEIFDTNDEKYVKIGLLKYIAGCFGCAVTFCILSALMQQIKTLLLNVKQSLSL